MRDYIIVSDFPGVFWLLIIRKIRQYFLRDVVTNFIESMAQVKYNHNLGSDSSYSTQKIYEIKYMYTQCVN